jgi:dihydrofolate synthase/folylpolyglutamate synthase
MVEASYPATLRFLFDLRRFGMQPGLGPIQALLRELGEPQRSFRSIHITGSKGKGSTAAMASSILSAAGHRTGLFTSPHLASYRERIRVDGSRISGPEVVDGIQRVDAVVQRLLRTGGLERAPTFFEYTTALAFEHFRASEVELGVIEVGLGGRLDSTNVLDAPVAVVTTLELEHTEILGNSLTEIASEKAGILRSGQHALVGQLPPEGRSVVDRRADELGVPVWHLGEELTVEDRSISPGGQQLTVHLPHRAVAKLKLPLHGQFQPGNAALAVGATDRLARAVGFRLTDTAVRKGLAATQWRGRLERWEESPELFVDVAHTPESVRAVAQSLAEIVPLADPAESAVVFGCLAEKRIDEMLETLSVLATTIVLVPVASSRSASLSELRRAAHGRFPRIVQAENAAAGLALARAATGETGMTLVVGSDYLIGELLRKREPPDEEEPDLSDPGLGTTGEPVASAAAGKRR